MTLLKYEYSTLNTLLRNKAGFGYDNRVSLQTDDADHMGAAVLAHVACIVGL